MNIIKNVETYTIVVNRSEKKMKQNKQIQPVNIKLKAANIYFVIVSNNNYIGIFINQFLEK